MKVKEKILKKLIEAHKIATEDGLVITSMEIAKAYEAIEKLGEDE